METGAINERKPKGGRRRGTRWSALVSLGLTAAVLGMWGRSQMEWDIVRVSLSAALVLELESRGGIVTVTVVRYEKHIDELDRAPLWSWYMRGKNVDDRGGVFPRFTCSVYPEYRPYWRLIHRRWPAMPPAMPVGSSFTEVNFPYWAVALVAAIPLAMRSGLMMRQGVRKRRGRCPLCGYDLRGTLAAGGTACPECGEAVGDDTARKPLSEQSEER